MDFINLKSLNLTTEESEHIIKFLARRRGITTKKLLSTIKLNLKCKNNKDLASKSQQKLVKKQQKLVETQLALIKSQQKLIKSIRSEQKLTKQTKSQRELIKSIKSQRKLKQTLSNTKKIRNHLYNIENKNKLNEYNNINDDFIENVRDLFDIENNNDDFKEKIDSIRKKLNEVRHNLPKSELKEIKKYLYNKEKNKLLEKNKEYLDELDKKIIEHDEDFIENIRDLFSVLDYEPILIKKGFDGNYLDYMSNGSNSLNFDEYLELIRPYLVDLINVYKTKGEWKLHLSAEISFISKT